MGSAAVHCQLVPTEQERLTIPAKQTILSGELESIRNKLMKKSRNSMTKAKPINVIGPLRG